MNDAHERAPADRSDAETRSAAERDPSAGFTGITHEALLAVVPTRPGDYDPWGTVVRWQRDDVPYPDCSCGCVFAAWLDGPLGHDWCVCVNPASHRAGLLTFEHQGCRAFVQDEEPPENRRIAADES